MKYKNIYLFGLAIFALWLLRVIFTGSNHYNFIVINIVLAAIPLALEPGFGLIGRRTKGLIAKVAKLALAFVWLLFLPNAFYILTDFMHLNSGVVVNLRDGGSKHILTYGRGDGIYVFDSLLLFAATAFGAYVGGLALWHAYEYFKKRTPNWQTYTAVGLIMAASAVGVYIGRFGRWYSWQGIMHPLAVVADLYDSLMSTNTLGRFAIVVLAMMIFQTGSLLYVQHLQKSR